MTGTAIIVGGGIGGLTAGNALKRVGWEVQILERAPEIREVGAGITLWTNAVKVLRKLGLGSAVERLATPLRLSELRTWNGKLLVESDFGQFEEKLGAPCIGIHRADLQLALAEPLAGELILNSACIGYELDANGVTVRCSNGNEIRSDILIGADGLKSVIRSQLLGPERPRYAGYTAWRGVGRIDRPELPLGTTLLCMGRGSQVGYLPIGNGRTYWFATANLPEGLSEPLGMKKKLLLELFGNWYEPIPAVIDATDESAILRNDIHDRKPMQKWGLGRMTLLGDAAHPTTPNLGQGACMAIEDSLVLARCLAEAREPVAGLRAYEHARQSRTAEVTNLSWKLGKLFALESRPLCWLRDRAFANFAEKSLKMTEQLIGVEV